MQIQIAHLQKKKNNVNQRHKCFATKKKSKNTVKVQFANLKEMKNKGNPKQKTKNTLRVQIANLQEKIMKIKRTNIMQTKKLITF